MKKRDIIALKYAFCPSYENPHPCARLLLFSLFLFSFPFNNVQGFQRFVESKFEPRFGNANFIEISADSI